MEDKTFLWNKKTCIIGNEESIGNCFFDYWTLAHFYFTGALYIILHHIFKIKNLKESIILFTVITILHIIEEYQGNTSLNSAEGLVHDYILPIFKPHVIPRNRDLDNDHLQNSIGDVFSGIVACIIIIRYWVTFGTLPYSYLLLGVPLTISIINRF